MLRGELVELLGLRRRAEEARALRRDGESRPPDRARTLLARPSPFMERVPVRVEVLFLGGPIGVGLPDFVSRRTVVADRLRDSASGDPCLERRPPSLQEAVLRRRLPLLTAGAVSKGHRGKRPVGQAV